MLKESILYLGNYLNEDIVNERKLPTNNTAGSNRIRRISEALGLIYNVKIISPAITLRVKWNFKFFFLQSRKSNKNNIDVIFVKSLACPLLGLMFSHFTYPIEVLRNIRQHKVKNVVLYNFGSLNLIVLIILKIFYSKIKIWNNIEDISVVQKKDFSFKSEDNLLQQVFFSFTMKLTALLSHGYIIPAKRFVNYLPKKKYISTINGCLKIEKDSILKPVDEIRILFSGKIAFEHGIKEFIEYIELQNAQKKNDEIVIDITGTGPKSIWLKEKLTSINNLKIKYHGFVDDQTYNSFLNQATICVALQKPDGRHANFKTPSKVYEYLGNSKIVIATNVGDLNEISNNLIRICNPLNAVGLKKIIDDVIDKKNLIPQLSQDVNHFAFQNYDYSNVSDKLKKLFQSVQ